MIDRPFKGMVIELPPEQYDRAMAAISRARAAIGALRNQLEGEGNCMCVQNAETNKATSVRVTGAGVGLRSISPEARCTAQVKLLRAKKQIRTHWCPVCAAFKGMDNGTCVECNKRLAKELGDRTGMRLLICGCGWRGFVQLSGMSGYICPECGSKLAHAEEPSFSYR